MKKCSSSILQHQFHKQWVEVEVVTEDIYNCFIFYLYTLIISLEIKFFLTSTNRSEKTEQNRFYSRMCAYRCSTYLVAAPLNNNLNALLKQHFNEWQTFPLYHTLSRSCFTKIAISFKKIPVTNILHPSLTQRKL